MPGLLVLVIILMRISLLSTAMAEKTGNLVEKSKEFYDTAMAMVTKGDVDQALAYFRGACRLNNQSAQYWNDLGVTEMRNSQLKRAYRRFEKALTLDPAFSFAKRNMQDLKTYLIKEDKTYLTRKGTADRKHRIMNVRRVTRREFTTMSSADRLQLFESPVLIESYVSKYKMQRLFDLKRLIEKFGNYTVDYYPHNMREEQARPLFVPLSKAITELQAPLEAYLHVDVSEPGSYIQWNLDSELYERIMTYASINVPVEVDDTMHMLCFNTPQEKTDYFWKTHWKMLLLGEEGAGMFLHQDILLTAAYQIQLVGRKEWHLCDALQSPYLYKAGDVDMFIPDYQTYPLAEQAACYEVVVHAGDLLFYPHAYWHQTVNHDTPSIAISSSVITKQGLPGLLAELQKECGGARRIFVPSESLCGGIERCGVEWKKMYNEDESEGFERDYEL